MLKRSIIFTILLMLSIIKDNYTQNIVNTLGTSGAFSVKDNTNTFFQSASQTEHYLL